MFCHRTLPSNLFEAPKFHFSRCNGCLEWQLHHKALRALDRVVRGINIIALLCETGLILVFYRFLLLNNKTIDNLKFIYIKMLFLLVRCHCLFC